MTCQTLPLRRLAVLALALAPALAAAETGEIDANGVPLRFTDEGSGPAIVLLHGFAGSSHLWTATGLAPMEGFRTITFDARGHGGSGRPETADAYGAEMVADVLRVMDARGVAAAHLVGYSMGAETALRVAVEQPDRVLSVVAAGSGWSGDAEAQGYAFIAEALAGVDTFGAFMAAMAPEGGMPAEAEAAMGDLLAAHGIDPGQPAAPLAAVAGGLPAIISIDAAALGMLDVPVLGIAGADDPEWPNVEALAGAVPGATATAIADADHLTAPLAPDFAAAVAAFLAD
ncbi:alpha/beta fold hydrolase [Wenxinia marina]|uniref:Putative hydrolase or acyltransferase (Alpha/beta hydrolase superfamily) n=1 Tax=Wenxinia marina DSM 24838 TaxID=1123501 RepID=A0A0D0Q9Z6_9RHOB|nr:alpha/beta hydrolase [Wenxinia marina]KIQ69157.1 putative hydrolase or acyltransferase (alpha/beta hydrolase superfamily) [Wenxinia marina DSM 24838]GGL70803.1 alpha/beta hydrolase [Wenxinia marina]